MAPRKPQPGTEVIDWEKEMEAKAKLAADAQRSSGGGGKFFSVRAGQLSFDGNALPGNQMLVVILADTMENAYYTGAFDPETPASPVCFAFGHDESEMEPHEAVDKDPYFERQSMTCLDCPQNEWGSAATGKGKACKNVMRLAMIPAGQFKTKGSGRNMTLEQEIFDEEEHFSKAEVSFLKLPVMSVKHYSKYVKALAADVRRPPAGVITLVYVEPDPKAQFVVKFELVELLDSSLLPIVMKRATAEEASIDFPYQPPQEEEQGTTARSSNKLKGKAATAKKPAAKGRR